MKRLTIWSMVFLGALFMAPAWSHHPAEDIISDDVWQRIDDHLTEIDSPHLNIDFDDVMSSMRVREDPNYGCHFLVTSITVHEEDADDYAAYMDLALEELMQEVGKKGQESPGGSNIRNCNTPAYEVLAREDDLVQIFLYEPIGAVKDLSDTDPGKHKP